MNHRDAGFTVIELMITVAVIAVLATVAAPSMRDLVKNARMTALVNDFMTDLNVARGEAVKRGLRTAICTSNNGTSCTNTEWRYGWIVFTDSADGTAYGSVNDDDAILKVSPKIDGADEDPPTRITAPAALSGPAGQYVGFRPSGVVTPGGGGPNIEFHMCDSRNLGTSGVTAGEASNKGRRVTLTGTGRAHAVRCSCPSETVCNP